ncbi:MAG: ATP-dependent DNA helicase UvrD/PcrA [uncultured Paraburkholderia sp.]|nr:MAG: ATP-dependent DNA helicase UvrD/PcrA [uncultured Paraburkholderia sp.]CAH2789611.1 MAG: ATP-dependent DNA helicase UvrD/PcrA [uncultured Paraburkholderia sp.]CAH2923597.1 MAG: ATP-dependent DNA helicase UvrD/PcrA [uncultured Paraburkholderia sp.]CAH2924593.1 MAG: ATP-dependent DNA helicase UvrD/PcrA [uncultured Paraburkholderia sp.]
MPDGLQAVMEPISDREIAWACAVMRLPRDAFAGEDGTDPRLVVMRSLDTLDIEACPGSGKTTLLVAKLAFLLTVGNRDNRAFAFYPIRTPHERRSAPA